MTTTPVGGDAQPVAVSSSRPKGLIAIPAYGYTLATLPGDIDVEGGDAQPVYLVSQAQIDSGEFALQGDAAPVRLVSTPGRPLLGDVAPIAVFLVAGSL